MMHYLRQIFISTGLIGLLAIPAMTQARTEEAGFQSNGTAFEPSYDSTVLNNQPALDQFPALVDLAQATQSDQTDAQETQVIEQRNGHVGVPDDIGGALAKLTEGIAASLSEDNR